MEQVAQSLRGGNILRKDVVYDEVDLMTLLLATKHCTIRSLIRCYESAILLIRDSAKKQCRDNTAGICGDSRRPGNSDQIIDVVIRIKVYGKYATHVANAYSETLMISAKCPSSRQNGASTVSHLREAHGWFP